MLTCHAIGQVGCEFSKGKAARQWQHHFDQVGGLRASITSIKSRGCRNKVEYMADAAPPKLPSVAAIERTCTNRYLQQSAPEQPKQVHMPLHDRYTSWDVPPAVALAPI